MIDLDKELLPFDRNLFLNAEQRLTYIGSGAIGGKAHGLAKINQIIREKLDHQRYKGIAVSIPAMTVIRTDVFEAFMKRNNLEEIAHSDQPNDRIVHAFLKASLPAEILGDLRALIAQVKLPLAIRSSSLLEDALHEPFAGIYGTKMVPNNQTDSNTRFNKLVEAIKYVYATAFFRSAKDYMKATTHDTAEEKMAVIIQEVIGSRFSHRFYPELSGVCRSHNYYAFGHANPEEGIVSLAFGLGKTIVDGGLSWSYCPRYPRSVPPFNSVDEMMKNTQTTFWGVNMGKSPPYDPVNEAEYLFNESIVTAEEDRSLRHVASTLDMESGRMVMGTGKTGPRLLNFAPLLHLGEVPLNDLLIDLMSLAEKEEEVPVEIEFAMTFSDTGPHRFGFLQVRPMAVSTELVEVEEHEMSGEQVLAATRSALGNGLSDTIYDIVYLKKDQFDLFKTHQIRQELEVMNKKLINGKINYLLIGFGRWGTSDPTCGIPVNWGQISGARAIIEAALAHMNFEQSQGSHFFHNVTGFGVLYFSVPYDKTHTIDWQWLDAMPAANESEMIRHVRLPAPLNIKVDGRKGYGRILKPAL